MDFLKELIAAIASGNVLSWHRCPVQFLGIYPCLYTNRFILKLLCTLVV